MEEKVLKDLGFSERETKVYLALLELGEVTVGPIAAKTRIQHSKVYQTIDRLIDRGLIKFVTKSKTKHFEAVNPDQILNILKSKEREFKQILPKLKQLKKNSQEPQTSSVYEGYNAIKSLYESLIDSMSKKSYYYAFAFLDEYLNSPLASHFLRNVHQRLAEKNIDDRIISNKTVSKEFIENYSGVKNVKFKFTKMNIPFGLAVVDDCIINLVWGDRPTAIKITSKQIASRYKKFFLELWNNKSI